MTIYAYPETRAANHAAYVVRGAGGSLTFDEYAKAMKEEVYWRPVDWLVEGRAEADRQAAVVACDLKYLEQTEVGYRCP
jgi:hypothetical protein